MRYSTAEISVPARPILSPHFGFKVLVGSEIFTVISIASVNNGIWGVFLLAHVPRYTSI
uniref:Transmembrane protein n=1 Tax=Medicago truncatula TaxID=3880 RepID=I3T6Y0_MEDTR|nr:unknown [Medicago truncatula]